MPHTTEGKFLADAGLETWLLFIRGFDMPCFASFPLLRTEDGRAAIEDYFAPFLETARQHGSGFIMDTVTWRANPDWGKQLGFDKNDLVEINREAVIFAKDLRRKFGSEMNVLINGAIGPRGDGYDPATIMSVAEAEDYHQVQVDDFAQNGVDMVTATTMTNAAEATGVALAAGKAGVPCVISFTLETDAHLPTGQTLAEAIKEVDASCAVRPIYYMINCAHPEHFNEMLEAGGDWINRIHGLRANASRMSHAELDECEVLDDGNPQELGQQYADLRRLLPKLNVFGGCCGTDHRHVAWICTAVHAD
ncbi:MAG: homocysteine S-methyltransferase family protein [Rhodobacteraceae bacterium]|nr:homocysteine S-methyltransferase family protein [Paracoccaceae bacterium]